jgi:oligopeptide/dipeptide ABC transporter ATP-binding protein
MVVMYLGTLIEKGEVRNVLRKPGHPYTQGLMNALPRLDDLDTPLTAIKGDIPSPLDRPSGCVFNTRCPVTLGEDCESRVPIYTNMEEGHEVACHIVEKEGAPA